MLWAVDLTNAERSQESSEFWKRARLEPLAIRFGDETGLTLCTPSIDDDEVRTLFLSDDQSLHVASSVDGLVDLVRRLPGHRLLGLPTWRDLAWHLESHHVEVLPEYVFDFPAVLDNVSQGLARWEPNAWVAIYNLSYELAKALGEEEMASSMEPDSSLYDVYCLVGDLDGLGRISWPAYQKLEEYDLVSIFDSWADIADILAERVEWHD